MQACRSQHFLTGSLARRSKLCSYNINLTYPQNGIIPHVPLVLPSQRIVPFFLRNSLSKHTFLTELTRRGSNQKRQLEKREREENKALWKRDFLSNRPNNTLDPWVGRPLRAIINTSNFENSMDACFLICSLITLSTIRTRGVSRHAR